MKLQWRSGEDARTEFRAGFAGADHGNSDGPFLRGSECGCPQASARRPCRMGNLYVDKRAGDQRRPGADQLRPHHLFKDSAPVWSWVMISSVCPSGLWK